MPRRMLKAIEENKMDLIDTSIDLHQLKERAQYWAERAKKPAIRHKYTYIAQWLEATENSLQDVIDKISVLKGLK